MEKTIINNLRNIIFCQFCSYFFFIITTCFHHFFIINKKAIHIFHNKYFFRAELCIYFWACGIYYIFMVIIKSNGIFCFFKKIHLLLSCFPKFINYCFKINNSVFFNFLHHVGNTTHKFNVLLHAFVNITPLDF